MTNKAIALGASASVTRTVFEADVLAFAALTGDINPIHVDEAWASGTRLQGRVIHGMLLASYISAVIAMKLPGPGTIIFGQELRFISPARIGDTITACVVVRELLPEQSAAVLTVSCTNQLGKRLVSGTITVLLPENNGE